MAARPHGEKNYISREGFAARYGASKADMDKITEFAHAQGLEVVEASAARRTVVLKGTVEQMSKAFAVDLGVYESPKEKYRGREGAIYVPADIVDIVEGVFGLSQPQDGRTAVQDEWQDHEGSIAWASDGSGDSA